VSKSILVRYADGCIQVFDLDEDIAGVAIGDFINGQFVQAGASDPAHEPVSFSQDARLLQGDQGAQAEGQDDGDSGRRDSTDGGL
jgi:hypothetical protein